MSGTDLAQLRLLRMAYAIICEVSLTGNKHDHAIADIAGAWCSQYHAWAVQRRAEIDRDERTSASVETVPEIPSSKHRVRGSW